jgi:hypothetical protein
MVLGLRLGPGLRLECGLRVDSGLCLEPGLCLESRLRLESWLRLEPGLRLEPQRSVVADFLLGLDLQVGTGFNPALGTQRVGVTAAVPNVTYFS